MKLIIVGAGEVGRELIKRLQKEWSITVIDEDEDKLKKIIEMLDSESMNRTVLLQGDGTSKLMLKKAGIEEAKAFVACTGDDEVNIEACRLAKEFNVSSIFAVSNSTENDRLYEKEEINFVDKAVATASLLEREIESGIVTPTNIGLGKGEIIEVTVMPTSIIAGYPVGKFSSKRWRIVAIFRGDRLILPKQKTIVKPGDRVLIVGDPKILKYISGLIKSGEPQFPLQFGVEEVVFLPENDFRAVSDARFFFNSTKLQKISVYSCFPVDDSLRSQFPQQRRILKTIKHLKQCEKEFIEIIREENFGLIVIPDKYKEFPLFLGIKPLPILAAEETYSPVLIARGTSPVKKIIVPISGSFSSFRALEAATELSLMWEAELTAIYVASGDSDRKVQPLKERLAKFSNMYKIPINFTVRVGNPVTEFAKESKKAQLAVIGARKRTTNWFNPYPPYHMIHRAACSAILICVGD